MKTLKFIWACLAVLGMSVCCTSCSSDEEEPIPEPEEDEVIYGTPTEDDIGKLYDISHDRKTWPWVCTFGFYFGDNPSEELIKRFSDCTIQINYYSQNGYYGTTHVPADPFRPNYEIGDTFTLPYYTCEQIVKFEIIIRPSDEEERKDGTKEERWEQDFKPVHDYFKYFQ